MTSVANRSTPPRVRWAFEALAAEPTDRVLEIGCGRGVLAELICESLAGGSLVAIDRSPTAIKAAEQRNAAHIQAGTVSFQTVSLAEMTPPTVPLDKIIAVNVNLFWVRPAGNEFDLIRRMLGRSGRLCLAFEVPSRGRADDIARRLAVALTEHGFSHTVRRGQTPSNSLLAVLAGRLATSASG